MRAVILFVLAMSAKAEVWTTWVEPCPSASPGSGCLPGDPELAEWALGDWASHSAGSLTFHPVETQAAARLVIHWVPDRTSGLYGETRGFQFHGKPGAVAFILPAAGGDNEPLLRDAIVYLTCLHESGHALGLAHTDRFADIMYSFQFGGDIPEYFARYRRKLHTRSDIQHTSAISAGDRSALITALQITALPR